MQRTAKGRDGGLVFGGLSPNRTGRERNTACLGAGLSRAKFEGGVATTGVSVEQQGESGPQGGCDRWQQVPSEYQKVVFIYLLVNQQQEVCERSTWI
jgi:hypothetical protein